MGQIAFDGFITCDKCVYGRNLGGNDWACRCERRRAEHKILVHNLNKEPYSCEYAESIENL